ncbi:hypothetical protein T01_1976 [Trichinella spiralis]|uniref:Uncharacterized protein n=1 Tax=Trichinella spiralis TaxID=6334 RepID=A0A0V1B570_TRISP|nr:hypothetical protein T01_1976 [Trichinella spiralis]
MPKLKKGATPNELIKATLTVPLGGVTITTRLAPKQSLGTTSIANLHNCL